MTFLQNSRDINSFYEKISNKAKSSQRNTKKALTNFDNFCREQFEGRTIDEIVEELKALKTTNEDTIYDTIQSWLNWNREKIQPSTLNLYFTHLKQYLHYRGIKLSTLDIKENLTFPKAEQEELYPLQLEDIQKIFSVASYAKKSLYLAQLSSGMRIGEIVQIRKKDLDLNKKRIMVKIPARFTKLKRSRITFISIEAARMIRPRLKRIEDDDLVWGVNDDYEKAESAEFMALRSYLEKVGLDERYETTQRLKISSHSFRAYFITKLSRHDENFAKKLAGQKGYLLQYDRMTDEEKLEKYLEIESDLLVFDESKKNAEIEKLRKENSKIESHYTEALTSVSDRVLKLEKELSKFKS